jgi:hypothetical protein
MRQLGEREGRAKYDLAVDSLQPLEDLSDDPDDVSRERRGLVEASPLGGQVVAELDVQRKWCDAEGFHDDSMLLLGQLLVCSRQPTLKDACRARLIEQRDFEKRVFEQLLTEDGQAPALAWQSGKHQANVRRKLCGHPFELPTAIGVAELVERIQEQDEGVLW